MSESTTGRGAAPAKAKAKRTKAARAAEAPADPVVAAAVEADAPSEGAPAASALPELTLPDAAADAAPAPTPEAAGGLRIVLAEDEALIRLDLAEMIEELGHVVVGQASNGQEAVALVTEHTPDLVVMDIKMPVMDGLAAAEAIGKDRLAPVIMLTAFSQTELVERARDAGVMAYVVKPFTKSDLAPAISIARSRWTELKALEEEVADLAERLETRKTVDRAKAILMSQLKLSEADAFRWIQKTAMDRRLGMKDVAEAVIKGLPSKK